MSAISSFVGNGTFTRFAFAMICLLKTNFALVLKFLSVSLAALFAMANPMNIISVDERRENVLCSAIWAIANAGFNVYPDTAVYL